MRPERFHRLKSALTRRQPDLTVLMDHVHKSHNFSAILRNCDAVGVLEAHVVVPDAGLDLHHRTSAGTKKWVSVRYHSTITQAFQVLREGGFRVLAAHPDQDAIDYRDVDFTRPSAIVMGAELHGVSDEALKAADEHVSIPLVGMTHSLNVSVATALLLFEAFRQRQASDMYNESRLPKEEFNRKLFEWAYPSLAHSRRKQGEPYPSLTEDGQIINEKG